MVEIGPKLWVKQPFEILAPIGSHVNENEKKNHKNFKILEEKNSLEIWWIRSFAQNLTWIHAAVSEKPELNRWTDDGCLHHIFFTVALLTKPSRANYMYMYTIGVKLLVVS